MMMIASEHDLLRHLFGDGTHWSVGYKILEQWRTHRSFPKPIIEDGLRFWLVPAVEEWILQFYGTQSRGRSDTAGERYSVGLKGDWNAHDRKTKKAGKGADARAGVEATPKRVGGSVATLIRRGEARQMPTGRETMADQPDTGGGDGTKPRGMG